MGYDDTVDWRESGVVEKISSRSTIEPERMGIAIPLEGDGLTKVLFCCCAGAGSSMSLSPMEGGDNFRRVKNDPANPIKVDVRSGDDEIGTLGSDAVGLAIGLSLPVNHLRDMVEDDLIGLADE
jgi:hypothetical protein